MKIYLMRHGEASFDAPSDDLRELTESGRDKIKLNIEQKQSELEKVALLLSSPILRAKQTSEIAKKTLQWNEKIERVDWLIHESNPSQAIISLNNYCADHKCESVMLFTHQPFASCFVERLCGLQAGEISMPTASIVSMETDIIAEGFGKIIWQLL